ncbi:MAG TPA: type V CRISPR-associated protein Cas12a/Cpf1 [Candidatus Paceibacterota bacterium]|nr:type V CRISPR-associated protein Cas12a/Cpf1 [Candidatus Paceibacterota bacterium]HSA36183.1 type V CRISPR-associated protein Cas12a/Cpf1 [Candidatus Paceibacterota bacterium]
MSQSEIDSYNSKVGNLNYLVNLYYQQTKNNLPKFKSLFKQIGCGEKKDFLKTIKDNDELNDVLTKAKNLGDKYFTGGKDKETVKAFTDYLLNLDNFENIYWSDKAINTISGKYFGNFGNLKEKLIKAKIFNEDKNSGEAKVPRAVQLSDLFEVLDGQDDWDKEGVLFRENFKDNNKAKQDIIKNAQTPHEALLKMICNDIEDLSKKFIKGADEVLKIEKGDYQKDESKIAIKAWLDDALFAGQILKYWRVKAKYSIDGNFTEILDKVKVFEVVKDYDVVRNYLTQKPQNKLGKLKLNFENSSLAAGWDINKEKDNSCVILQNEHGKQYLAIMKYEETSVFEQNKKNELYMSDNSGWKKINYKLLPGPNKMLPKVLFSSKWVTNNPTPANIKKIYGKGTFKKGDNFNKNDLHILLDFYKNQLKKYPSEKESWDKIFNFDFSNTKSYESVDRFYAEVEKQGYKLEFIPVKKNKIEELVENGKIYLFEIKSKDSNLKNGKEKTSAKDLQTIYWNRIFSDIENKPKLNGEAEIFYRPALEGKNLKRKKWKNKEIIENFRFSKEKFIFHCPITLNPCLKNKRINDLVNQVIVETKNQLFLGIDRGEKNLAYYSLVNQRGEILEQGSFNIINKQNYWEKLDIKQGDRDLARKNWTTIGNIKDLKDGYISQVVRKIVDLAVYNEGDRKKGFRETPALIILEDLNIGFKRGRQKIEKQVYQKLELALAKKLNFLVDKSAKDGEMASVDNALQFTPPVHDFNDIKGKQFGIMFYTNPSFTSATDPITGWHKTISIKKGSEIKEQIFDLFSDFGFDGKDYYFKYKDANIGKEWILYSGKNGAELDRYRDKFSEKEGKKHWSPDRIDIVKNLENIFKGFDKNKSFKEQIKDGKELNKFDKERTAWESLRFVIDVIQQIRNTGEDEKDNDFILSPVRGASGDFFDSRKIKNGAKLPQNGDANGAYNIARKGIIMSEHIKRNADLFVRNEEWDAWLAGEKNWVDYMANNLKIRQKTV